MSQQAFPQLGDPVPQPSQDAPTTAEAVATAPVTQPAGGAPVAVPSAFADLTLESLQAKGSVDVQNQFLGDLLYQQIRTIDEPNAAKVTGMMLGLGQEKCINDLRSVAALQKTVGDALNMLKQQETNQPSQ